MVKKKQLRPKIQQMSVGLNPYAHMLLDPEHAQVMGVPDEYPYKTHKAKIAMSRTAEFDSNGDAFCTIGRSLKEFFGQKPTSAGSFFRAYHFQSYWVGDLDWIDTETALGAAFNPTFPPHFFNTNDRHSHYPTEVKQYPLATNTGVTMIEVAPAASGDNLNITANTIDTTAGGWKANAVFLLSDGTESTVESAALTGSGTSVGANVLAPANTIGIKSWGFVRQAGTGVLSEAACILTLSSELQLKYEPIGKEDGTEFATLKALGTRARIVAMSLWAQYSGSLTSNGKIAAGQITHQDLTRLPDTDIGTLSVLPGFYADSLLKPNEAGAYAWFRPLSAEDLKFEDLDNPDEVGSRLMCAIHANDANAQNVTFRCVAVVEIQTTNQVVTPTTNIVSPPMIWEAQRELKNFPSGMGNTNHLKLIANKLKSIATNAAHKIGALGPAVLGAVNFLKDQGANVPLEVELGVQKAMQYAPAIAGFAESIL
jgi:hypothetical protein